MAALQMVAASPMCPDWLFDYYEQYNPPAYVGRHLRDKEWHQRAFREDQQAAGLLPPDLPGGTILCTCAECAYQVWKQAINGLWAVKRHCQCLIAKQAACARQEATRRQQLLDEQAAHARQEAAALCQCLLDKRVAEKQQSAEERTAQALQQAAAQTIFLWLCRQRLHVRLARQTLRRQQNEAALARLHYKENRATALAEAANK
jgi:hypothetical protein